MTRDRLMWIIKSMDFDELTPWEEKFIADCEKYFENNNDLSFKMEAKLEEIHREKSSWK